MWAVPEWFQGILCESIYASSILVGPTKMKSSQKISEWADLKRRNRWFLCTMFPYFIDEPAYLMRIREALLIQMLQEDINEV